MGDQKQSSNLNSCIHSMGNHYVPRVYPGLHRAEISRKLGRRLRVTAIDQSNPCHLKHSLQLTLSLREAKTSRRHVVPASLLFTVANINPGSGTVEVLVSDPSSRRQVPRPRDSLIHQKETSSESSSKAAHALGIRNRT